MNQLINKARACAVTGHRILLKSFSHLRLIEVLNSLISDGYDTFLIGMALGFDTECFKALLEIKKQKEIKIIACIPCKNQTAKFTISQKKEYDFLLTKADEKIVLAEEYSPLCMRKRNIFMVDNTSCVLAYIYKDYGGTASTVKYALKNNVKVIYL